MIIRPPVHMIILENPKKPQKTPKIKKPHPLGVWFFLSNQINCDSIKNKIDFWIQLRSSRLFVLPLHTNYKSTSYLVIWVFELNSPSLTKSTDKL